MADVYLRRPNISCLICKKSIYRRPAIVKKNGGRVFCSMICYGMFCRKEAPCIVCGKLILASQHKKTCGRSCANINRTGIRYKILSPRDKAKLQRAIKSRLLIERGMKCERCDYNEHEILQVHHRDRDRKNNRAENLEIVCPNCHYKEHYSNKHGGVARVV